MALKEALGSEEQPNTSGGDRSVCEPSTDGKLHLEKQLSDALTSGEKPQGVPSTTKPVFFRRCLIISV